MARNGVDQLVEKWLNEPGFRDKMKSDPEGTVKASGISLNTEEWATVRNVVMTPSDEALRMRASKIARLMATERPCRVGCTGDTCCGKRWFVAVCSRISTGQSNVVR